MYAKELEEDVRTRQALSSVEHALLETQEQCAAFALQFDKYSHLWLTDIQQTQKQLFGGDNTQQGPSLDFFAAEISKYKVIEDEVQAIPSSLTIGWIKVDVKPLKQALLTWTSKWVYMFMRRLRSQVGEWLGRVAVVCPCCLDITLCWHALLL